MLHRDPWNEKLTALVHPTDWVNPQPAPRYNLVVIGAGPAGLVCALGAAALGARVALVERAFVGGDCLNFGCVPSKALIAAAAKAKAAGVSGPEVGARALSDVRRLRSVVAHHDRTDRLVEAGIDLFFGDGVFVAKNVLVVEGAALRFRRAVIATGARAAVPPIPGLAESGHLTNETIFELETLPQSLLILGAGPIGCELAQSFARLGSEVTVFDIADRVMSREDPDASARVQEALLADGVKLELGAHIVRVEGKSFVLADGREPTGEHVLVAAGRKANIEGLGLEAAGIAYDGRTGLVVDDRLRTTNRRIFAIGDVASHYQFTHAADAMARNVLRNALFFGRAKTSSLVMPWATYTQPEVAHVGMTAQEAEKAGSRVLTLTQQLAEMDRAILEEETDGFARVHVDRKSGRVLGATMVAPHAGEAIGQLALAVTSKLSIAAVGATVLPYPTVAETWKRLADQWNRTRFKPWIARLFERWFRIFG